MSELIAMQGQRVHVLELLEFGNDGSDVANVSK